MHCSFPGYEPFCADLGTLLTTYPPPFVYVRDVNAPRTTFGVIDGLVKSISSNPTPSTSSSNFNTSHRHASSASVPTILSSNVPGHFPRSTAKIYHARVDSVLCFTPRLFYECVINALVGWEPSWADGCTNWTPDADGDGDGSELKWNDSLDGFMHGLYAAREWLRRKGNKKGKQKASTSYEEHGGAQDIRFVITVERPERLKETHPELIVPLTRLGEMTERLYPQARMDICVIFASQVGWEDVKPPLGASPDPLFLDVGDLMKENIVKHLIQKYAKSTSDLTVNPYHPTLAPLYRHFTTILVDVCYPFTHDPNELQYIAAARWPGFVKPLIDEYEMQVEEFREEREQGVFMDEGDEGVEFLPPQEDLRIRLIRYFSSSLTGALESLLPRHTNAADWARDNMPPDNLLSLVKGQDIITHVPKLSNAHSLSRMSKYVLIASYLASTNPAKSDLRMFGRGLDEKKRKRRVVKAKAKSGTSKVAQRLLGPTPFPLDRMVAILGALLEENDVDSRLRSREYTIPGEYTDMEIGRVGIFSTITELTSMNLLHRTSPSDRLDGPPMYKCAVSYDAVLALAKELDVQLGDLLWDPV